MNLVTPAVSNLMVAGYHHILLAGEWKTMKNKSAKLAIFFHTTFPTCPWFPWIIYIKSGHSTAKWKDDTWNIAVGHVTLLHILWC